MNRMLTLGAVVLILAAPIARADQHIDQKNKLFSADSIDATVGEPVTFTNSDDVTHDLSLRNPDGSKMESQMERPGDSHIIKFEHPGQYRVNCLIHPKMRMTINVH